MNILANIFGLGAMISLFLIYQQKSRGRMIAAKLSADVFWVAHYSCLGGTAGLIPNLVGIFREIIFSFRKKHSFANSDIWPVIFVLITWVLGLRTFNSIFNVLPIVASSFVTIALWIDDPRLTKKISLPVSAVFLIYDIYIGSYIGIINEAISIFSIIFFFARERKTK